MASFIDTDPCLEGMRLSKVTRAAQDVLDLVTVVSGVEHYRLEVVPPGQTGDPNRAVLLVHLEQPVAEGAAATGFPQRIGLWLEEEEVVSQVWVLLQSPLVCERTGAPYPPQERRLRYAGDLNDFLLLHLCTGAATLHTIQTFLDSFLITTPSMKSDPTFADAVRCGLQIDIDTPSDDDDENEKERTGFVAKSILTHRSARILVLPNLVTVIPQTPTEGVDPPATVNTSARFSAAAAGAAPPAYNVLAPLAMLSTRKGATAVATGAGWQQGPSGRRIHHTYVPSIDGVPSLEEEEEKEEFEDKPEDLIEHGFLLSAASNQDSAMEQSVPVFHEQTMSAFHAIAKLLLE